MSVDLDAELAALHKQKADLADRKLRLIGVMEELNAEVRGRRLSNARYTALCREQSETRQAITSIERDIVRIKGQIHELSVVRSGAEQRAKVGALESRGDVAQLVTLLVELARKYQAHAEDSTRVASTRIMAARFSDEIRAIIQKGAA